MSSKDTAQEQSTGIDVSEVTLTTRQGDVMEAENESARDLLGTYGRADLSQRLPRR